MSCLAPCLISLRHSAFRPLLPCINYPPDRTNPWATPQGLLFGRVAEQSPLTDYEPNAPVEVSSAEVTTTLLPSRKEALDRLTTLAALRHRK